MLPIRSMLASTERRLPALPLAFMLGVLLGAGPATADDSVRFAPSITLQQLYSSNVIGPGAGAKPDIVTQVSPGFTLDEEGAQSDFNVQYTPTFNHFDMGNSQDRIDQQLLAIGKLTPLTDHLIIDMSAYSTETGGSPTSTNVQDHTLVPNGDRILFYLGTIAPHFTTHFGDVATVDAYYRLKSANTSDQGNTINGPHPLSGNSLNQDAQIVVGSAESFGRLSAQINLDHSIGTGSGQNNQSQTDADFIALQYHFNHALSLNGTFGYQSVHYDASLDTAPFTNQGPTWTIGVQLIPNIASSVNISYGLKQGVYVPTVEVRYAIGPRTQIAATYDVQIQNQLQSTLQNLQYLVYDAEGNPIDSRTGLPFAGLNAVFGTQNVLFRDKPAIVSLSHQFERSGFTVSATYEKRTSITGFFAEDTSIGGRFQYTRQISPVTNCSVDLEYTNLQSTGAVQNGAEHAQIIDANFSLYYRLSETATLIVTETYVRKISSIHAFNLQTNQAIVGLRKEF